jgi:hypothetical protein
MARDLQGTRANLADALQRGLKQQVLQGAADCQEHMLDAAALIGGLL